MKRTTAAQPDVATLFIAASELDSNLYYATRFVAPDPFIYMEVKGERILVMSDLEMDRAKSQASVDRVLSYSELEKKAKSNGTKEPSTVDIVHVILREAKVRQLLVPANFPFIHATRLQELGYSMKPKRDPFYERRVVKTAEEVRCIEAAQRATEDAVAAADIKLTAEDLAEIDKAFDKVIAASRRTGVPVMALPFPSINFECARKTVERGALGAVAAGGRAWHDRSRSRRGRCLG